MAFEDGTCPGSSKTGSPSGVCVICHSVGALEVASAPMLSRGRASQAVPSAEQRGICPFGRVTCAHSASKRRQGKDQRQVGRLAFVSAHETHLATTYTRCTKARSTQAGSVAAFVGRKIKQSKPLVLPRAAAGTSASAARAKSSAFGERCHGRPGLVLAPCVCADPTYQLRRPQHEELTRFLPLDLAPWETMIVASSVTNEPAHAHDCRQPSKQCHVVVIGPSPPRSRGTGGGETRTQQPRIF